MTRWLAILAALAVLAAVPLWVTGIYYVNIASQILIFAIFALGLNVLVGYAGLVSLGHAGLFGIAAYAGGTVLAAGSGHGVAALVALGATLAGTAIFAMLALRATGIGFIMITLALGQIVWGLGYRWISLTNGDNGVSISSRPSIFGVTFETAASFYCGTFVVFVAVVAVMAVFVASPFGAALRGAREQPRRMTALGYHVWMIRFCACMLSGLVSGVSGMLFLYYNEFISPQALALPASAEALLMVISGGSGTLLGPIAGAALVVVVKNVASAYIERWNFMLGAIFVAIVIFMPEGFVPGSVRLWGWTKARLRPRRQAAFP